nr:hypothetical protein [Anaerolineae bacterium]
MLTDHLLKKVQQEQQKQLARETQEKDRLMVKATRDIQAFFEYEAPVTITHLWPALMTPRARFLLEGKEFEICYENEHLFRYWISYIQDQDEGRNYIRLNHACDLLPYIMETA